ncbi:twin-arginine translocation signal domain-containing protein [Paraburkholderia ginsengisoli]|uniref:Twin-arginine translocation signal domain-containing protein n=1 Tax=Paraburkholderia ginsengisoli TaxID=311231 RepID=A0A7T4N9Z0_9BURK|nr:twin-arginine translocation signal domain-containing protein [Paraburkholderia ginsengisoli]QQC67957.1 twin-arginine translocation signal domain-containing protein [Paraburkholderia ginsengisoli]
MERRKFLKSTAALGLAAGATAGSSGVAEAQTADGGGYQPDHIGAALARFRKTIPANFDRTYVENAVVPFFLTSLFEGERPLLPMIDLNFSKENALPHDLWGLIYKDWKPTPEEGVTVFLQGLEKRGDNNLRKRIYFSAVTPDLYRPMYGDKVTAFFDQLMAPKFAGKPFMRHYLDYYFDVYWDLHLGVKGDAIPTEVRQIGEAFNTVLAYRDPSQPIVYKNYMLVRKHLDFLKQWIDKHVEDIGSGRAPNAEKTMAWYWLKNAGNGEHFSKKDIVFECFHNFVAFSQWGNTIFGIMSRLSETGGDAAVRAAFQKTMSGDYDNANGAPYTPLELFIMELFRTISPNGGSVSSITDARESTFYGGSPHAHFGLPFERNSYVSTPHTSTSHSPVHWTNPDQFDPERYRSVPTSAEINEETCKKIGLARCPFDITTLEVKDGRNVGVTNSGFGTVFGVVDGKPKPVCDYAGFAPFGFSYRRCPGEQFTIQVFEDFLRKVWHDKIVFQKLALPHPGRVPVGPGAVIDDNIGFSRSS